LLSKLNIVGSFPARRLHPYTAKSWKETLLLQPDPKGTPDIPMGNSNANFWEAGEGRPAVDIRQQQQRNKQTFAGLLDYSRDLILRSCLLFIPV